MKLIDRITLGFGALVNIGPNEWTRVIIAWFLKFFWQVSFMMSWTLLTVLAVDHYGIANLPYLYLFNAALIIAGAFIFSGIMHRFSREKMMMFLVLTNFIFFLGALQLEAFYFGWFMFLILFSFSCFLYQQNILTSLFIEDLFTPLEGERTFPFIESAETIGGVVSGLILALFVTIISAEQMFLVAAGCMLLIYPILFLYSRYCSRVPRVETEQERMGREEYRKVSFHEKIRKGFAHVRKISFLKGLFLVVLIQWIVFTVIQFEYTNAVSNEVHLADDEKFIVEQQFGAPSSTQSYFADFARVLEDFNATPEAIPSSIKVFRLGDESSSFKESLTHSLGVFHVIFSLFALIMQLLFASRIIGRLGILSSMLVYMATTIFAVSGMLFRYGIGTAFIARANEEVSGVLYRNSYHTSYYTLKEGVRDYVKEFFEGVARPIGILFGTLILLVSQQIFTYDLLIFESNFILIILVIIMMFVIVRLRKHHTLTLQRNLFSGNPESKCVAVELLSQPGHKNAHEILVNHLRTGHPEETVIVNTLYALGKIAHPETLPEILNYLEHENIRVQLAALEALIQFKGLDKIYFNHLFTRYRVLEALKDLFVRTTSQRVSRKIVRVFSYMRDMSIVEFLVHALQTSSDDVKADCIYVMGLFNDISVAHYIEPYLAHAHPKVRLNAVSALWRFHTYRLQLVPLLNSAIESVDKQTKLCGIVALGDIQASFEEKLLVSLLASDDEEVSFYAAQSLMKMGNTSGLKIFSERIRKLSFTNGLDAYGELERVPEYAQKQVYRAVNHAIVAGIHSILTRNSGTHMADYSKYDIDRLIYFYTLLGQYREVMKIVEQRHSDHDNLILDKNHLQFCYR